MLEKVYEASQKQDITMSRATMRKYMDLAVAQYPPAPKMLAR